MASCPSLPICIVSCSLEPEKGFLGAGESSPKLGTFLRKQRTLSHTSVFHSGVRAGSLHSVSLIMGGLNWNAWEDRKSSGRGVVSWDWEAWLGHHSGALALPSVYFSTVGDPMMMGRQWMAPISLER